jgi:flagellar assembly protein FliH
LKAIHAVVEEVRQWRDSLTAQGEQILVEMLKEIAQTMFGEGVRLDANALQINLNRVMENAQKLGDLNIFLNTRDVELLDPSWSEYQLLITGNKVKIIPSEKITPGGCIVKGNMGMVDGRVETQLAAIMNTIEEISGAKE